MDVNRFHSSIDEWKNHIKIMFIHGYFASKKMYMDTLITM
jgi:hypothetical protein